jgi:hypothetical protein
MDPIKKHDSGAGESLAWWQGQSIRRPFDPFGEIFYAYRHRSKPDSIFHRGDDEGQQVVAEPEGEERLVTV